MAACVFCAIAKGETHAHVVFQDDRVMAFLDVKPLFHGHVLVIPKTHIETLSDLAPEMLEPLFARVRELSRRVPAAMGAQGSFVAMNNVVSQSVPHLHVHVVPRTKGDGLKGFFWPRTKYASRDEADAVAAKISGWISNDP